MDSAPRKFWWPEIRGVSVLTRASVWNLEASQGDTFTAVFPSTHPCRQGHSIVRIDYGGGNNAFPNLSILSSKFKHTIWVNSCVWIVLTALSVTMTTPTGSLIPFAEKLVHRSVWQISQSKGLFLYPSLELEAGRCNGQDLTFPLGPGWWSHCAGVFKSHAFRVPESMSKGSRFKVFDAWAHEPWSTYYAGLSVPSSYSYKIWNSNRLAKVLNSTALYLPVPNLINGKRQLFGCFSAEGSSPHPSVIPIPLACPSSIRSNPEKIIELFFSIQIFSH